jgi:hypothetical protein
VLPRVPSPIHRPRQCHDPPNCVRYSRARLAQSAIPPRPTTIARVAAGYAPRGLRQDRGGLCGLARRHRQARLRQRASTSLLVLPQILDPLKGRPGPPPVGRKGRQQHEATLGGVHGIQASDVQPEEYARFRSMHALQLDRLYAHKFRRRINCCIGSIENIGGH